MGANRSSRGSRLARWAWAAAGSALLAACVSAGWPPGVPLYYHRTAEVPEAERVGAEECELCHEDVRGRPAAPLYHQDCEACHGGGSIHYDSEEIADIRFPANDDCLGCHQTGRDSHLAWNTSEHARSGVLCTDCHASHDREPQHVRRVDRFAGPAFAHAEGSTRLCVSCHPDVAARLDLPSHHPIREGMLGCTDCHAPHENRKVTLGAATARCTSCHQDVAGPWIFEHAPVAEDCGHCHAPHGAVAPDLLTVSQPAACISCHSVATMGATHDPQAFVTQCTDCHGAVHGSYTDRHLRK